MKKQYAVIGMGKFGAALALELARNGCDVLAVDKDQECINEISESVTAAVCADVTDPRVFQELSISNMDAAIICISEDMEASILATLQAKESGTPCVIAKGMSDVHANILRKVGADRVIMAERETGIRLAKSLVSGGFTEMFGLSDSYSIAELVVPKQWIGKNLIELNLRSRFQINVIGINNKGKISVTPDPKASLTRDMILILIGEDQNLKKLLKQEKEK